MKYRSRIPAGCPVMIDSCYPDEGFIGKVGVARLVNDEWRYLIGGFWYWAGQLTIHVKFRNNIVINDIDDFNDLAQEIMASFVELLMSDERYMSNDVSEEYGTRYFNARGVELLDRYMSRLARLAGRIFPPEDLEHLDLNPHNLLFE